MIPIQHTGDPIETEAIEMKFFQPIFTIRQQKTDHFIFSIIEATGIPQSMFTPFTRIKILVIISGKTTQSFGFILDCMRMHKIHDHTDTVSMCLIDQTFQVVGCSESGTDRIKIRYLIAERTIIGMFLNPHQLNHIVPQIYNPGQYISPEFIKRRHPAILHAHTDMSFVNQRMLPSSYTGITPPVNLFGLPDLR